MNSPSLTEEQKEVVRFINESFSKNVNPICALGMGWGKTYIACEIIRQLKEKEDSGGFCILLICKAINYKEPWQNTLSSFGINECDCIRLHGKDRFNFIDDDGKYKLPEKKIIITSYTTALKDLEKGRYELSDKFDLIIFDELHTIINAAKETQTFNFIVNIPAKHKLALSGTPIQNYITDIIMMYLFLNDSWFFQQNHQWRDFIKKHPAFIPAVIGICLEKKAIYCNLDEIKMNQGKKEVFLSLPIEENTLSFLRDKFKNDMNGKFKYLSHPGTVNTDIEEKMCTKLEAVKILLRKIPPDEKIIIFSRYIAVLDCYYETCKNEGVQPLKITGNIKGKDFEKKLFQFENSDFRVLLTTLQKTSMGLNLQCANNIIILELWWNPQKIFQAMSRIKRPNQTKKVFIYLLANNCKGEIIDEEKMFLEKMQNKINDANKFYKLWNQQTNDLPDQVIFKDTNNFKSKFTQYLETLYPCNQVDGVDYNKMYQGLREDLGKFYNEVLGEQKFEGKQMLYYILGWKKNYRDNKTPHFGLKEDKVCQTGDITSSEETMTEEYPQRKKYIPEGNGNDCELDPEEIEYLKQLGEDLKQQNRKR